MAAKTDQADKADKAGRALIEAMALHPKQPDARPLSRVARIS
jgi:long-chain acyl-CoA synthetase